MLKQEFPVTNPIYVVGVTNAPRVYVIGSDNAGNGQVSPFETANNNPDGTVIPVGKNPVYGVMSADGKRAFILNKGDGTVSVINAQTNQLDVLPTGKTNPIAVGTAPLWADFAPSRNELVVANAGDGTTPGSVSIISIPLCSATSLPGNPNCDATNPVDSNGFGTVLATVPVGVNPQMVGVLQDGTRAYVVNQADSTVSVINLNTNTVTAVIPVPATVHPNYIAVTTGTPTGKVYVTSPESTEYDRHSHRYGRCFHDHPSARYRRCCSGHGFHIAAFRHSSSDASFIACFRWMGRPSLQASNWMPHGNRDRVRIGSCEPKN